MVMSPPTLEIFCCLLPYSLSVLRVYDNSFQKARIRIWEWYCLTWRQRWQQKEHNFNTGGWKCYLWYSISPVLSTHLIRSGRRGRLCISSAKLSLIRTQNERFFIHCMKNHLSKIRFPSTLAFHKTLKTWFCHQPKTLIIWVNPFHG